MYARRQSGSRHSFNGMQGGLTSSHQDNKRTRLQTENASTDNLSKGEEQPNRLTTSSLTRGSNKAVSPMQCAEMVFGNITNIESSRIQLQTSAFTQGKKGPFVTVPFTLQQEPSEFEQINHSQMTTQQLLRQVSQNQRVGLAVSHHTRSKTMPEFQKNDEESAYQECESELRQQNMILEAEKTQLTAELIFYKNELARLCLKSGARFPVFCASEVDSVLKSQKFLRNSSSNSQKTVKTVAPQSELVQRKQKRTQDYIDRRPQNSANGISDEQTSLNTFNLEVQSQHRGQNPPLSKALFSSKVSQEQESGNLNQRQSSDSESMIILQSPQQNQFNKLLNKENQPQAVAKTLTRKCISVQSVTVNLPVKRPLSSASMKRDSSASSNVSKQSTRRRRSERANGHLVKQFENLQEKNHTVDSSSCKSRNNQDIVSTKTVADDERCEPKELATNVSEVGNISSHQIGLKPYEDNNSQNNPSPSIRDQQINETNYGDGGLAARHSLAYVDCPIDGVQIASQSQDECYQLSIPTARSYASDLNIYQASQKKDESLLTEKEKLLESSHKELQEKLAQVRNEIRELQEMPSDDSRQHTLNQTIQSCQSVKTLDHHKDQTRTRVEQELEELRQQLQNFNEEENKVLQELEETKTLRQAFEDGGLEQQSIMSESFNLLPQRLNFDSNSQKQFGLHSPERTSTSAFNRFQLDMTLSSQVCPTESEETSENTKNQPDSQEKCVFAQEINVDDYHRQIDEQSQRGTKALVPVFDGKDNGSGPFRSALFCVNNPLQFSQILEEEGESESATDNSRSHSRCVSIQALAKKENQPQSMVQFNYGTSEYVNQLKGTSQELQGSILINLDALDDKDRNQVCLFDNLPDDSKDEDEINTSQFGRGNALDLPPNTNAAESQSLQPRSNTSKSTMQKFERLIQDTQQSDEGGLLRHIQRNLEHMKSSSDFQSHFAMLQQQQSPSPPVSVRSKPKLHLTKNSSIDKKYFAESSANDQNSSVDTLRLIQEFQQQDQQQLGQTKKETTGDRNTQMSETIQFLAAAGYTGTTLPVTSYRSSAENQQVNTERGLELPLQKNKSRNCTTGGHVAGAQTVTALSECQIKILQDPKAAETMSSGLPKQLTTTNSIELLSKASPYFQEHCNFELTRKLENRAELRPQESLESHRSVSFATKSYTKNDQRHTMENKHMTLGQKSTSRNKNRSSEVSQNQVTFCARKSQQEDQLTLGSKRHQYKSPQQYDSNTSFNKGNLDVLSSATVKTYDKSISHEGGSIISRNEYKMKKSCSQQVIETIPKTAVVKPESRGSQPSLYGHRRASVASQFSQKTQLLKPVRQQVCEQTVDSSGAQPETRSSYNIYKRNSVKMARVSESVDLNNGLVNDSILTPVHLRSIEMSDSQMHHAASQSTLNLEMRSPFTYEQSTPNSMMNKVCESTAVASHNGLEGTTSLLNKASKQSGRCNSTQLPKNGTNSGTVGVSTTVPRKYQTSYNNYINGDCDDEVKNKRTELSSELIRAGKKSAGQLGKSVGSSGKHLFVAKSKSQLCLTGAVTTVRPSTANLYKRNQETALSRPLSSTKMTTANEAYSQFTTTANSRVQTALQASRSEKQIITAGAWSQRTSNMNKQVKSQRSNQTQSMTSSKYLAKVSTARGSAQAGTEVLSQGGGAGNNVVLFADSQPSYMKPIQQKFRKQTIRMVQEREKENGLYIPNQAELQIHQQNPTMLSGSTANFKEPSMSHQNLQQLQKNQSQSRLGLKSTSAPYL